MALLHLIKEGLIYLLSHSESIKQKQFILAVLEQQRHEYAFLLCPFRFEWFLC